MRQWLVGIGLAFGLASAAGTWSGCRSFGERLDPSLADERLGLAGEAARRTGSSMAYERYILAEIRYDNGDLAGAIKEIESAYAYDAEDEYLAERLALWLTEAGERRRARRLIGRVLREDPMSEMAWLALAVWHRSGGATEAAVAAAQRAIRVEPSRVEASLWLAEFKRGQGDFAYAAEVLRRAAQAQPEDPDVLLALGRTSLDLGRYVDARRYFARFLALGSRRADVIIELARAHRKSGDPAGAADFFEQALSVDPTNTALRIELIDLLFALNERSRAERHILSLPLAEEGDARGVLLRASFLARVGDYYAARTLLSDQLAFDPMDPEVVLALAAIDILLGRLEAAALLLGGSEIRWTDGTRRCRAALDRALNAWPEGDPICGIDVGEPTMADARSAGGTP